MNKRNLLLPVFAVVAAAQLAVPAWMIIEHERTLREGQVFKFKTRPVDPADAFRGRYVWLSLAPDVVNVQDTSRWLGKQKAFAVLDTDTNGFVCVKRLEQAQPAGEPALRGRVMWPDAKKGNVHIQWTGLDRYYMTEKKAPAAETAYWDHNRSTNRTCHVTVRVRAARAVIENLFIENQPVQDWLRKHKNDEKRRPTS